MKPLRLFVALILVAGTCLTGRSLYMHGKAALAGVLIRRAWNESARTGESHRPWPQADMHPIARLRIARLGYDEIVLDSASARVLAFGPARLQSGAALGEPGNLVLAGHRDSWFKPLEGIVVGDEVEVEWRDVQSGLLRRQSYVVDTVQVVKPDDTSFLAPTPGDALTLWTCYPFGRSPHSPLRYVVRASPRGPSQVTEAQITKQAERAELTN